MAHLPRFVTFRWQYFYGWAQMQTSGPLPQTLADCQRRIEPYLDAIIPADWGECKEWPMYSNSRAWYEKLSILPIEQRSELQQRFRTILSLGFALICQRGCRAGLFSFHDDETHWPVSEATLSDAFTENIRAVQYGLSLPPFSVDEKQITFFLHEINQNEK